MDRWRRGLALVLGAGFIVLGIAETIYAARGHTGGVPFWFGSLCGGGTLILIGTFALSRKNWLSFSLTALGSVAAAAATTWTIILPLVTALLVALALITALRLSKPPAYDRNPRSG